MEPLWEAGGVPWLVPHGGSDHPGDSKALLSPLDPAGDHTASLWGQWQWLSPGENRIISFKVLALLCFRSSNIAVPREKHLYTITSFDEFLKDLKVTSGTSQLLFQFPDHLAASWIFNIFLCSFQP